MKALQDANIKNIYNMSIIQHKLFSEDPNLQNYSPTYRKKTHQLQTSSDQILTLQTALCYIVNMN